MPLTLDSNIKSEINEITPILPRRISTRDMSTMGKSMNVFIQIILLLLVVYIISRTVESVGVVLFTWHPVLVSLGYLLLMSHAILCQADNNVLTRSLNYQQRVTVHWILQASAFVLITIAQTCIYFNKERLSKSHYQSTHAIFGLITYLLTVGAMFGGVFAKFSFKLKDLVKPVVSKIAHGFLGVLVYYMAVITICLGVNQFFKTESDAWMNPAIFVLLFITSVYVTSKSVVQLGVRSGVLKSGN